MIMQKQARALSAKIIYSNPASDIVSSVKTTAQKVHSLAKQFEELFILLCYFYALN